MTETSSGDSPVGESTKKLLLGHPEPWAEVHGRTNVGKIRSENQDRMLLEEITEMNGALVMVADGMGGHTGGSQAAQIAVDTARDSLTQKPLQVNLYEQLRATFSRIDSNIRERAQREAGLSNMGTTGVAALLLPHEMVHLYIGDSRLYHFRNGVEIYRTKDHSVVRYLEDEGLLTEEEARVHPMRSRLTSSLGGGAQDRKLIMEPVGNRSEELTEEHPAIRSHLPGDILLICSDGLCGEIDTATLHALVTQHPENMAALTEACVASALAAGGRDNITVIAVRILTPVSSS